MAIAFDVASSTSGLSQASLTWSHTCTGTGTDGILLVAAGLGDVAPGGWTISATYNGVAMTAITGFDVNDGNFVRTRGFYMLAPPTGAHNIVVTYSPTAGQACAGAISLTGVDQTTPFGTAATGSGASGSPATCTVSSATGEWVMGSIATDSNANITINGSGNSRWEVEGVQGDSSYAQGTWDGAASVTVSWTQDSAGWAIAGIPIKPAAAGGTTMTPAQGAMAFTGRGTNLAFGILMPDEP